MSASVSSSSVARPARRAPWARTAAQRVRLRAFLAGVVAWSLLMVAGLVVMVLVGLVTGDLVAGAETFSSGGAGCAEIWLETPHAIGSGSPTLSACGPVVSFGIAR